MRKGQDRGRSPGGDRSAGKEGWGRQQKVFYWFCVKFHLNIFFEISFKYFKTLRIFFLRICFLPMKLQGAVALVARIFSVSAPADEFFSRRYA